MKWEGDMPAIKFGGETATHFVFNLIITRFGILRDIVTDHGRHFQNRMMDELSSKLGYKKDHSSSYYPQENGQVEVVNKSLKSILQRTVAKNKNNWHILLYPNLWAYRTVVKIAIIFSPY